MYIAAILCDSFLIEPRPGFIGESGAEGAAPLLASGRKQKGLQKTERESISYQGCTCTILWQSSSQKGFKTCSSSRALNSKLRSNSVREQEKT